MTRKMIVLGHSTDEDGTRHAIGVPIDDLKKHAVVFGTTGSGKSTFLTSVAAQSFGLGTSTCIIEPHGDLCSDTLSAVPDSALHRVVYLALDSAYPPAIPLMSLGLAAGMDVAVGTLMNVLRMAEPSAWDASTRMREVLRNSARVLLDALGDRASLIALDRFLSKGEEAFREQVLARVSEDEAKSRDFCRDEISRALESERGGANIRESILGAQRRLEIFVTDKRFRRTLAVPPIGPRISFLELLRGGRLVLVPANKAAFGEQAAPLVSMLILQMVKSALMGRLEKSAREQALIIMDEFTAMAGDRAGGGELADITNNMLMEARKFGASLVLATQSLNQLTPEVKSNLSINTNHKIVLLVSDPAEARDAQAILGDDRITDTDIRSMPKYHGYFKLMAAGNPLPPCLLQCLPPMQLVAITGVAANTSATMRPNVSAEFRRARDLARTAHPAVPSSVEAVVTFLRGLDDASWQQVVADAQAWGSYLAHRLLAEPHHIPNKAERVQQVSGYLWGLPWWLREAHYWRERRGGATATAVSVPRSATPTPATGLAHRAEFDE